MMMIDFNLVCFYLASLAEPIPKEHRVNTCLEVAQTAIAYKIDPYLALALAYHESRFDKNVVSPVGAVGPMQIMRRFIDCKECNDIEAGMIALRYWLDRSKTTCEAIGKYVVGNNGKCGPYSKKVISLSKELNCAKSKKDFCFTC